MLALCTEGVAIYWPYVLQLNRYLYIYNNNNYYYYYIYIYMYLQPSMLLQSLVHVHKRQV